MKILEVHSAALSNEEALAHVKQIFADTSRNREFVITKTFKGADGSSRTEPSGKLRGLRTICDDIVTFFSGEDSALAEDAKQVYEPSGNFDVVRDEDARDEARRKRFAELAKKLKPYKLTEAECLMIVNHRPQSESVLEVLIEEVDARFTPEQQEAILAVVAEVLVPGS